MMMIEACSDADDDDGGGDDHDDDDVVSAVTPRPREILSWYVVEVKYSMRKVVCLFTSCMVLAINVQKRLQIDFPGRKREKNTTMKAQTIRTIAWSCHTLSIYRSMHAELDARARHTLSARALVFLAKQH